jgi:hypothetical protein
MITGEQGARKPASPVREEIDGKGPGQGHLAGGRLHLTGGGWKRNDPAMVTAVKRPAGETRGKVAAGPDTGQRHRASPRPYAMLMPVAARADHIPAARSAGSASAIPLVRDQLAYGK